ncbi:hypothetical protein [Cetobacterium somerae]|uniref:hypothetical protein n=1 Tax=Cetobacterium somerae TaxID=188913 RepID=UPI00248E57A9|nr:hypothetical protein [Cetobacterium somerae]
MKKFNLFMFIFGLFFTFNCFGKDLKKSESVSIPVVVKAEIVEATKVSENIKTNENIISIKDKDIKEVFINKKNIYKKNNSFSYNLDGDKRKFIEIDIKL